MGKAEQDFIKQQSFVLMGNTRRMRFALKGFKALGKTVYVVDEKFSMNKSKNKFADLSQVSGSVDAAIIDSPFNKRKLKKYVLAAAAKGIKSVWLNAQSAPRHGVDLAREKGMDVLHGQCVVVWLPTKGLTHSAHRGIWKLLGKY